MGDHQGGDEFWPKRYMYIVYKYIVWTTRLASIYEIMQKKNKKKIALSFKYPRNKWWKVGELGEKTITLSPLKAMYS